VRPLPTSPFMDMNLSNNSPNLSSSSRGGSPNKSSVTITESVTHCLKYHLPTISRLLRSSLFLSFLELCELSCEFFIVIFGQVCACSASLILSTPVCSSRRPPPCWWFPGAPCCHQTSSNPCSTHQTCAA